MAKVTKHNGEGGSTAGMYFHSFSGRPIDQYESPFGDDDPRDRIGDVVVMTDRMQLVGVVTDEVKDGTRQTLKWKCLDSKTGKVVERAGHIDPNQYSIEDYADDTEPRPGDYGDEPAEANPQQNDEPGPDAHGVDDSAVDPAKFSPFTVVGD